MNTDMITHKHLLVTGFPGAGKSTLIRKVLEQAQRPVYGFRTSKGQRRADGIFPFYMEPYTLSSEESTLGEDCLIGIRGKGQRKFFPEVFDRLGVQLIRQAKSDGILVMDELGSMESEAAAFRREVLAALHGDIPVVASVKNKMEVEFLNEVRACQDCLLVEVTKENRDKLAAELPHVFRQIISQY